MRNVRASRSGSCGALHEVRQGARGAGPPPVRRMHRQAPRRRPRPLSPGQSLGRVVRRQRSGSQTPPRPEAEPQAPSPPDRGGTLHPVRAAAGLRREHGLRALPGGSPRLRPRAVWRPPGGRALRRLWPAGLRGRGALRRLCRRRYAERRARDACTDCGRPAYGACRCAECAEFSARRLVHPIDVHHSVRTITGTWNGSRTTPRRGRT